MASDRMLIEPTRSESSSLVVSSFQRVSSYLTGVEVLQVWIETRIQCEVPHSPISKAISHFLKCNG